MADYLVKLYELKHDLVDEILLTEKYDVRIVRVMTPNKSKVLDFISAEFSPMWADEVSAAFSRQPVTCYAAVDKCNEVVGFAAYECTSRGYFGPTGVKESCRGQGIGKVLLLKSLHGLRDLGYAYAIIGGANERAAKLYERACGATLIEGSERGIYKDLF